MAEHLTIDERRILRGYVIYILNSKYPHHCPRELLDETLRRLQQWKGEAAVEAEVYFLGDLGLLKSDTAPDPEDPTVELYSYCLTVAGRRVALGETAHADISMIRLGGVARR